MERSRLLRTHRFVALALLLTSLLVGGCAGPLLTAMYLFGAADTPAEFKGLKKKSVVVVCRPLAESQYGNMDASKQIAREVGKLLKQNKIKVISHEKVDAWLDANIMEEPIEIGRALNAEMVVAIDLLSFDINQGQTLYQGRANYSLKVIDCKTEETVFEKSPDPSVWPPNSAVPASEMGDSRFRNHYIGILSQEIARHFYAHDPRVDFASDASALK
ncbi:MAG: hypothetical protein JW818_12520 [Pirellulales bacterium]|nr:hypothetical protein [Pirellulales bacterium]